MAANASSNGANTVKGPAPFRFSFKPDLARVSFNLLNLPASLSFSITFPNVIDGTNVIISTLKIRLNLFMDFK